MKAQATRILFLTHRCPYAPNRGDRIRAYHLLQTLSSRFEVDVVSLVHDREEAASSAAIAVDGVHVSAHHVPHLWNRLTAVRFLGGSRPLTHLLLDSPTIRPALTDIVGERRPDVVLAYCSGMAQFALEPPLDRLPLVLDMVDVDSEKWRALADGAGQPKRWIYRREARCLAQFESVAAAAARATLVVNERERVALRRLAPGARIVVSPNGVDVEAFRPPTEHRREERVVFCGVMNYGPNVDAACWLAEAVWPRVRARRPEARLALVGASPDGRVRRLAKDPTIDVTGTVPDVREYLWSAAIAAAPLRIARGVQNKVLEAAAAGLPVVVTSAVAQGLPREVTLACTVADTGEAFADAIVGLLGRSDDERRTLARRVAWRPLTWSERLSPVLDIISEVAVESVAA